MNEKEKIAATVNILFCTISITEGCLRGWTSDTAFAKKFLQTEKANLLQ